jgi:hypothetical protein
MPFDIVCDAKTVVVKFQEMKMSFKNILGGYLNVYKKVVYLIIPKLKVDCKTLLQTNYS